MYCILFNILSKNNILYYINNLLIRITTILPLAYYAFYFFIKYFLIFKSIIHCFKYIF